MEKQIIVKVITVERSYLWLVYNSPFIWSCYRDTNPGGEIAGGNS